RRTWLAGSLPQKKARVGAGEMAQRIGLRRRPEPELRLDSSVRDVQTPPQGRRKPVSYLLQLPPEYSHGRFYPVLIVLHAVGETPRQMLDRFSELAAARGYILAAPEWANNADASYGYTGQEHLAVLDVVAELRRHFQVDSDRIFLAGHGNGGGGDMAFDVALSHPDLFAGVVPMGAQVGPLTY